MIKKIDLLYGTLIAIVASALGTWILVISFTNYGFVEGLKNLHQTGKLGKVIALGSALNVVAFFILLKYKKEMMARGVVLGTIILTIFTLLL